MKYLRVLLICIPVSFIGLLFEWNATIEFFLTCFSIIPLAGYFGSATEKIATYAGPKLGGFLNASFGNATELIISFFAIRKGYFDIVKASLTGSILGNMLLVFGCSILVGGLKNKELRYNAKLGGFTATMLLFAVIGLSIPTVFTSYIPDAIISSKYENLSVITSIILIISYIIGMLYSFKSQEDQYGGVEYAEDCDCEWSLPFSILILGIVTTLIAIESEMLVNCLEPMVESSGMSKMFISIILIPIVGNAAENSTAVIMAYKNKFDLSIEIAVGSSLQIALFAIPVSVLLSLLYTPMNILFHPIELFLFGSSVFIVNHIVKAGRTNWMEGLKLLSVYLVAAIGFFVIG